MTDGKPHASMSDAHPMRPVTLLFTDIVDSSGHWERNPDAMAVALARHDTVTAAAVGSHRGTTVKAVGDGVLALFDDPIDAVACAVDLQHALAHAAADKALALGVRCALHTGTVVSRNGDVFGPSVNRCARLVAAAHGEQVLLSQATSELVRARLPGGTALYDLGKLRLRGLADSERVHQLLHPRLRREFPALRSLERPPHNLPVQLTSLVGRDTDLHLLRGALRDTRLVTLTGAGGLGKTRLAVELGLAAVHSFPDGAWFVDLAAVSGADLVVPSVATALGLSIGGQRCAMEPLIAHLQPSEMLLILDNCEHLVDACAALARQLLQACDGIRIVATSRQPLGITGELVYTVNGLTAPSQDATAQPDDLLEVPAVRLFVDRARAVHPKFRFTADTADAVAHICRRLDGIPLALELAAARVRVLSVEAIGKRLGDRFGMLERSDRTGVARHQTLHACIAWSYDLLTGAEQALLRRLAVFAGGFTLDAAESIVPGGVVDRDDVVAQLTGLADKSLVSVEESGDRYRLLETIAQFVRALPSPDDESNATRAAHLRHYLALAEEADRQHLGDDQARWHARVHTERENLLAALRHCDVIEGGDDLALRLVYAVHPFWYFSGPLETILRLTERALVRMDGRAPDETRCHVMLGASDLAARLGLHAAARAHAEACLVAANEIGSRPLILRGRVALAGALEEGGSRAGAREQLDAVLSMSAAAGESPFPAALNILAEIHRSEGNSPTAVPLLEQALAAARCRGHRMVVSILATNLANALLESGQAGAARAALEEALSICAETGAAHLWLAVIDTATALAFTAGDNDTGARLLGCCAAQRSRMGVQRSGADGALLDHHATRAREVMGNDAFSTAERIGRATTWQEGVAQAQAWLGPGPLERAH